MEQSTAQRRLVKSPPELWAEVSSEDTLGHHLAQFGEIRITRTQPETTVAWEGDRASGTVELAPAGWGTKVILTATLAAPPTQHEAQPEATAAPVPAAVEPQPEPAPEPRPEPQPVAAAPDVPATPRAPQEPKLGFFARLFRRRPKPPAPIAAPPAEASTPSPDPSPPALGPEPPPPDPDPAPILQTPQPEPETAPAPAPQLDAHAILTEVLDDLGAAHRRPFSQA
jgi:hypothetical protein